MTDQEILSHVDHTLLKADTGWPEIQKLCEEAIRYGAASVCIPPSYVKRAKDGFPSLNIGTVVGFPLGYSTCEVKVVEAAQAVANGAAEIDMVANLGDVKNGDFDKVTAEIAALRKTIGHKTLKVIIETCYLTEDEKTALCRAVTGGGADYLKTSTGFGPAGAKIEDIRLFKKHLGAGVKIKAAGGIKTREDMERFLGEGCDRIGSSSAIAVITA
ncbi:MAG: deoxyribose-phosphate aldolase [Treponema sp.]|jgi:deoxyribose-phosphate aldolase|nr:deoxyribose-phosphate aldolase [Treponema sp.]